MTPSTGAGPPSRRAQVLAGRRATEALLSAPGKTANSSESSAPDGCVDSSAPAETQRTRSSSHLGASRKHDALSMKEQVCETGAGRP